MDTSSKGDLHPRLIYPEYQRTAGEDGDEVDRRTNAELRAALAQARSIVDTVREPLLVLDKTLHVVTASRSFYNTF